MATRRTALGFILQAAAWTISSIGLQLHRLPRALAETGKRILTRDTDPSTLISENPKHLDTSGLQVIPLEEFGQWTKYVYRVHFSPA